MFASYIIRRLHISSSLWSAQTSALAVLRKKTGYTFANCKKALELHNNDIGKAEEWLKQQAQSMGWTKATKLQGRQTTQGLIGVLSRNNVAAMVELNCETDFVARNEHFQNMVETAVNACLEVASKQNLDSSLVQLHLDSDDLKALKLADGKTLADHLALVIGTVGENASLRRALCYKVGENVKLAAYAHPAGASKNCTQLGKFGGLLALTQSEPPPPPPPSPADDVEENVTPIITIDDMSKQLCQHIVGMRPTKIGSEKDVPEKNIDDEKCLIYQEFLLDDSVLVGDLLKDTGIEIMEFKRFECGEESIYAQPLDTVETCQ